MLPRKQLILLRQEFDLIRANGRRYDSPSFGLLVRFGKAEMKNQGPKFAFVVSKKVDRRSVIRHEVKRKLSDAVAKFVEQLSPTVQLVFLAKQAAIQTTRENLVLELTSLLRRAKLLT